ncbi:hypothetical protein QWY82_01050 [Simiduia curdlanivorans]|uniref:Uncharacterized protein n=1 Tax=Simiduia curdlanivorans TaxID=1492769 RepID=A0ABV8V469_9GAMM|nr:hypothetical protein [Simiduia curdlanivorans]MDN3637382.1 hypothetical protein [Simiduia curdlanivorans]
MFKHYFELVKFLTIAGNIAIFLILANNNHWQLGVLEWFLGMILSNAPILLYTPWFKRMAVDLQGSWANLFSYLSPILVGAGGVLTYGIMISIDNFGFWLYFLVPFGQAVVFNILLAFAMQAMLWSSTPSL